MKNLIIIMISSLGLNVIADELKTCDQITTDLMKAYAIPAKGSKSLTDFSVRDYGKDGNLPKFVIQEKGNSGISFRASKTKIDEFEIFFSPSFQGSFTQITKWKFKILENEKCEFVEMSAPNTLSVVNVSGVADKVKYGYPTRTIKKEDCVTYAKPSTKSLLREGRLLGPLVIDYELNLKSVCSSVMPQKNGSISPPIGADDDIDAAR